ncbi:SDR family oxidoreductase [Luteibacter pinisoli]|uniref:SDR family oxidoreductase n=1 Tax=Luteibacter pinisoli TaxID=2589080 RepID=A0A4Y5Z664_9GAMM|nr:SDR family oxidoreductase [Luteibacter pinisoli]QDE39833.1 SDR family oxidoreductase [Luteibacter pinisoli]
MSKLKGKVAVVTGGNSGIGLAVAKQFIEEGAKVYITGRRQAELDKAVAAIGPSAVAIQTDVSKLADLDKLFAQVKAEEGRIDVLMLNAAFGEFQTLGEITEDNYDAHFNTNVRANIFGLQKALPLLPKGASVIITGSIAGSSGIPNFSVYGATKGALRAFVRSAIVDLKDRGIRVNILAPGHTSTPALDRLVPVEYQDQALTSTVPSGRLGTPEDMAKAALFLASDDSSYVNGAELVVDGGVNQI